jgi:hypothetical protein
MPTPSLATAGATASEAVPAPRLARAMLLASLALGSGLGVQASEPQSRRSIFQCELNGKKVTSDRLIPECVHKEQRELNPDGSLRRIVPPTLTADELAAKEQQERDAKIQLTERNDAVRRDRNLMQRFPNEGEHYKARAKALDDIRASAKISESRIALLLAEKKKLDEEREFYENERVRKPLPHALKQKIDANDAALEAQRSLAQTQEAEVVRINALYDAELGRLRKLWSGVQPGTLGPMPGTPQTLPSTAVVPAKSSLK